MLGRRLKIEEQVSGVRFYSELRIDHVTHAGIHHRHKNHGIFWKSHTAQTAHSDGFRMRYEFSAVTAHHVMTTSPHPLIPRLNQTWLFGISIRSMMVYYVLHVL